MIVIYLRYEHLCNIPEISLTNDFYEILVPVTLLSRYGIYLVWYIPISEGYCRYIPHLDSNVTGT